jgi:hypothetical protein
VIGDLRCPVLTRLNEAASRSGRLINLNGFLRGSMTRRNLPDVRFEVVHDSGWAVWLVTMLGGVLGVFALTALIVRFFIQG